VKNRLRYQEFFENISKHNFLVRAFGTAISCKLWLRIPAGFGVGIDPYPCRGGVWRGTGSGPLEVDPRVTRAHPYAFDCGLHSTICCQYVIVPSTIPLYLTSSLGHANHNACSPPQRWPPPLVSSITDKHVSSVTDERTYLSNQHHLASPWARRTLPARVPPLALPIQEPQHGPGQVPQPSAAPGANPCSLVSRRQMLQYNLNSYLVVLKSVIKRGGPIWVKHCYIICIATPPLFRCIVPPESIF
jgi:hypothetical protein